jgi:hypothetical protein
VSADPALIWLDFTAYAGRLLAGGNVPWLDAPRWLAWHRAAQTLLKSMVVTLPMAEAIDAWLIAHPELLQAMASKSRPVYALRTLLADTAVRELLLELARGLRAAYSGMPYAMVIPSPRAWASLAFQRAHGAPPEGVDEDAVESAAMYVADFLRAFADIGADTLLLEESAHDEPASVAALSSYQAVFNVAQHYRWDTGVRLPVGKGFVASDRANVDFIIAPMPLPVPRQGVAVGPSFWVDESPPLLPKGGFYFAHIAPAAAPEAVLGRLELLRVRAGQR